MQVFMNTGILPSPADQIVTDFVKCISDIEPAFVEGFYLTGSIPLLDFYPEKSDIDFVVLCRALPDDTASAELLKIHRSVARHWPKPDLSGIYLTYGSLSAENQQAMEVLSWHEGRLARRSFEMAPVTLTELKISALTVYGPPADTLPISISRGELNRFLYRNINTYWKKWITVHSDFFNRRLFLFLFPRFTEWAVLGVARLLYTLNTGRIVSKTDAGNYCLDQLPEDYHAVLRRALNIRKDVRSYPVVKTYAVRPSLERVQQTLACVNYMISRFNETYLNEPNMMMDELG